MKALRVNADYESELFFKRQGPAVVSRSLEFLALWLEDRPLLTTKTYDEAYLGHVEAHSGRRPILVSEGPFDNWWGELKDLERERWMNSKLTSAELSLTHGWIPGMRILREAQVFPVERPLLAKDPFGMSGMGHRLIGSSAELAAIKSYPVILEPLQKRTGDFSHYVLKSGESIAYENLVDQKFQYRGTLFRDWTAPRTSEFSFFQDLSPKHWHDFEAALGVIRGHYGPGNYSVDSFVYEEAGALKIHPLCEINYRRTMGFTAYELARRYALERPWCLFLLLGGKFGFTELRRKLRELPQVLLLSPDDVRFHMLLIRARDEEEGKATLRELKALLPDGQFPVNV